MALQFVLNNLTTKVILLCFLTQITMQLASLYHVTNQ